MPTSIRLGRATLALMLAAALFAVIPAAPAFAGDAVGAFQGTATLNAGISAPCPGGGNQHDGTFDGTIAGTHNGAPATGTINATFKYCNPDTVAGTAAGTFRATMNGTTDVCDFDWVRTGAVAVISIVTEVGNGTADQNCTGDAIAVFAPTSIPGAVPGTAEVAGEGDWMH